jgi:alpha-D-ribose 1-methylphosphonate 5-triphosphate synthase subunit PhnH
MTPPPLAPGLPDPVLDAQRCFRAVLEAMSRPGRVARAAPEGLVPPAPLAPAAAAVLLTLADADTPVWLDPADAAGAAGAWLRFHAGCPIVAAPGEATFVLAARGPAPCPAIAALDAGTEEDPHASATLVLQVEALEEGGGAAAWRLSGPGIESEHRLRVFGAPLDFLAQWAANRARFPRGVDVVLCAADRLAALPRGVRITLDG